MIGMMRRHHARLVSREISARGPGYDERTPPRGLALDSCGARERGRREFGTESSYRDPYRGPPRFISETDPKTSL
jgi:hypothetical protein